MSLIILTGLPGSGKSTWASQFVAEDPVGRCAVSRDGFRAMLGASPQARFGHMEPEITQLHLATVEYLLALGKTVVIDDTNIPQISLDEWQAVGLKAGVVTKVRSFAHVPLDECLRRNSARDRVVPEDIIRDMAEILSSR